MTLAVYRTLPVKPLGFSNSKKTPGDLCSWLTMTLSVPLIIKLPFSVIRGISPKYTSCSFISLMDWAPVSRSLSHIIRRTRSFMGAAYVMPF